jgi:microcystin-dependent protein
MANPPYIGEIRLVSFNFAPKGWILCDGQLLTITGNMPLFSLIGTTYGGDGRVNFAVPDLRGRVPMHNGMSHVVGEVAGSESVTLSQRQLPGHFHFANAVNANANSGPAGHFFAAANAAYQPPPNNTILAADTVTSFGENGAHENRQPYLGLSFAISLVGAFPSRN